MRPRLRNSHPQPLSYGNSLVRYRVLCHSLLIFALLFVAEKDRLACLIPFFEKKVSAAFRTLPRDGFIPGGKCTFRIITAAPERLPLSGTSLYNIASVLGTVHPGREGLCGLAFRISGTRKEFPEAA